MRMNSKQLAGVLAVFQTPFDADGRIDRGTLEGQFDWLFANGADGVVFAMVSEVLRLSSEERDELVGLTCKLAGNRGATVVSVGAESTPVAIRHARHAEDCGATAMMATPPGLHRVHDDELIRYFMNIAASVTLPLIVQDASGYVGTPLSIPLQAKLHSELGDRVMFKPEAPPIGPRLSQLLQLTAGRARVFEGTGGLYLIDSFRRGIVGTMPAGDLVWALAALWKALTDGDYQRAYRIAGPLAMMVSLQTTLDSFIAIEKYLLVKQGVFPHDTRREPVGDGLDDRTREEIERLMALLRSAVDSE
jgi:dihydrodipicolinate synthase/N-acetylneuraminate lyase